MNCCKTQNSREKHIKTQQLSNIESTTAAVLDLSHNVLPGTGNTSTFVAGAPVDAAVDSKSKSDDDASECISCDSFSIRLLYAIDKTLVKGFTPVYFVFIMGTGMSSSLLYNFPYPAHWLRVCSYIMFGIASIFWLVTTIFCIISIIKYPKKLYTFHCDPNVAPFMGCYAMGYNTLVNYIYLLTGESWIIGTYCLWWLAVFFSLYTACIVFYFSLIGKNSLTPRIETHDLNATLLLPIVTLTVASSSGGLFTEDLPNNTLKMSTMVICYILWSTAISTAFFIIAVYFWRLFVHKIPATDRVFTSFLPIGALGQGAYGVMLFGVNMHKFILENYTKLSVLNISYMESNSAIDTDGQLLLSIVIGNVILYSCAMISLFLISFGYFCTVIAIASCLSKISPFAQSPNPQFIYKSKSDHFVKRRFDGAIRFSKTFWAMTFPLGTMSLSNYELHIVFNNMKAFRVVGAMYATLLLCVTIGCLLGFLYALYLELMYVLKPDPNKTEQV